MNANPKCSAAPTNAPEQREDLLPQVLGKAEVCEMLGVSPRCLENMVSDRRFPPPVRIGKTARWSRRVIDEYLRRTFAVQEAFWQRAAV